MPDPLYLEWEAKRLFAYDMINCSECRAAQFIQHRDRDFEHAPTCSRRGPGQRPYMELLEVLKAIQDDLPDERSGRGKSTSD
ncbi:hypothetical protein [Pseudomonas sp. MWU16-30317]|uniref:hypothetical protein n=1 Tax=Pseudomonas sp. MWU16-30317 TaxID=2878095 RepID=UPI001CFBC580|nr:hypothetical protein [Pseudomonas sp. MWU16-30317]